MTRYEHYREAEQIIAELKEVDAELARRGGVPADKADSYYVERAHGVSLAQVHATLALATDARYDT